MLVGVKLSDIALICGGELLGEDSVVSSVKTDTREDLTGALFIALAGESFDGHDYLSKAMDNGAEAVLTHQDTYVRPAIKVKNTLHAYGQIARHQRDLFAGKVIAITGSNGKTTVKDWLAQCLSTKAKVLKTQKNNNNQVGVPLTLLGISNEYDFAVIEAGTSYAGEIEKLAQIIGPDIAVITNANGSHFSGLGSLEGIAIEKGSLLSGLTANGVAVLNKDDAWFAYWKGLLDDSKQRLISFGFSAEADMYASDLELHKSGSKSLIHYQGKTQELILNVSGKHQIANAMVVLICLLECGFNLQQGVKVLAEPIQISGRLEFLRSNSQSLILNDCYNASPTSVEAAIDVLSYQDESTKWLVLGALKELGDLENEIHKSLGEYAYHAGIDRLVCLGPIAAIAADAFQALGGTATVCNDHTEIAELLEKLDENNAILVKGSRSSKMENVINKIVN